MSVSSSVAVEADTTSRPDLSNKGFHVHFGAGKLGMGLVFNALV